MKHRAIWAGAWICASAVVQAQPSSPVEHGSRGHRQAGDVLSFALPAGVAAMAGWQDRERPTDASSPSELIPFPHQ